MTIKKTILTGVKPTGLPHIGNYFGAIKPALELANNYNSYLFIADCHALTTFKNATELKDNCLNIAAAWLALGVDPEKTVFYRQSDIGEIFELNWILSCFSAKGLLNRAHAYKSLLDTNQKNNKDPDFNINAGIFNYPILMAADILLFNADIVPVGADQKQHVEIARDVAESINSTCSTTFTLPEPLISKTTHIVPGIDGQKMSKNYNNTIPIFLPEKHLRKRCMQIVTDSTPVEDSKDPATCNVFKLMTYFKSESELDSLDKRYRAGGLGYGAVKQELFEAIFTYFKAAREQYDYYIANSSEVDLILEKGKQKAKRVAIKSLANIKASIGL